MNTTILVIAARLAVGSAIVLSMSKKTVDR